MYNKGPRLTNAQEKVYNELVRFWNTNGYSPSVKELTQALGLKSEIGVFAHLQTLEKKGYIWFNAVSKRTMIIKGTLPQARSLVSTAPILKFNPEIPFPSSENVIGYYPIPKNFSGRTSKELFVMMRGDYEIENDDYEVLICKETQKFKSEPSKMWVIVYNNRLHVIQTDNGNATVDGEDIEINKYIVAKVKGFIKKI